MRINRNVRIVTDPRGKIKTGYKNKKGLPAKTDNFMLVNPETAEVIFPELLEAYGEKPTSFLICFPSDKLEDVFNDNYNLYGKNNAKKRTCDGVTCTHIIDATIQGTEYKAGTETECVCLKHNLFESDKNNACKCDMYLKAYIFNPKTNKVLNPMPYLFSSHSINTADNIYFILSQIKNLKGIPFELKIKKVVKNDKSFTIWNIYPVIIPEDLLAYSAEALTQPETKQIETSEPLQISESTEQPENNSEIEKAIGELNDCITLNELKTVWENHKELQKDSYFHTAKENQKKIIKKLEAEREAENERLL